MYNLFVSGSADSWDGDPWTMDAARCIREYTDNKIIERYGELDEAAVAELKRFPCIFAYESPRELAPKFGIIRDVAKRQRQVRVEYVLQTVDPFLSPEDLDKLSFELDIGDWEMNRTHWAVKDINLPKELHSARGIILPSWTRQATQMVDISKHNFDVALSFPGEARDTVVKVAQELDRLIGPNCYFYDSNYVSQLARPSLDILLQDIYRKRSKLIVVFLSSDYQKKEWCGLEFRAIREIIIERDHGRIMFVRTDDGSVDGVFKTDGYIDARKFSAADIARFIVERVQINETTPADLTRLGALEKLIAHITPRSLNSEQVQQLRSQLESDPGYANITIAATARSAKGIFDALLQCFRDAGYETRYWVTMDSKMVDYITLKSHDIRALTARQAQVFKALTSIGLSVVAEYERPNPANDRPLDIWLVIR